MRKTGKTSKPFSNPRWNQDIGAVPTGKTFKLTEEQKQYLKEQDKKWRETLKKLKSETKRTE